MCSSTTFLNHSHPVQLTALVVVPTLAFLALVKVNEIKKTEIKPHDVAWETKRYIYWFCITITVGLNLLLDAHYPIDTKALLVIRTFFFSILPIATIDLYFSNTKGIHIPSTACGLMIHCTTVVAQQVIFDTVLGQHTPFDIVQMPNISSDLRSMISFFLYEYGRILAGFIFIAFFADLLFSPIHRFLHSNPKLYRKYHKKHHEFTNNITGFIGFYSHELDDLLMAGSISTIGGTIYRLIVHWLFSGQHEALSNLTLSFVILGGALGHAHDPRLGGSMLLPLLPKWLNANTYHHDHHLHPNRNFGLTRPMDMFWDTILGTQTIKTRSTSTTTSTIKAPTSTKAVVVVAAKDLTTKDLTNTNPTYKLPETRRSTKVAKCA